MVCSSEKKATMTETLLEVHHLTKTFGALAALNGLSLDLYKGELHAVIGPNGAGKTTLIGQLSGEGTPDSGTILFQGTPITQHPIHQRVAQGIARSYQITSIFEEMTPEDNVALAVQGQEGHSFHFWKPAQTDPRLRNPALHLLQQVGLTQRATPAKNLAHGEKRQIEIAMTLATRPLLLLLDEPLAGMGAEESLQMVELLAKLKGHYTILLVEHDMDAVFTLADRLTVLVDGKTIATGTPESIRTNSAVRSAYLGN